MYFTLKLIFLASFLMLVNTLASPRQICRGCGTTNAFCGSAAGGAPCCAGLTCTTSNICRGCGTTNAFCGSAAGGAPCCAGLTCTTSNTSNFSSEDLSRLWNHKCVLRQRGRRRSLLCRLNLYH
ncbi:hypothetical protein C8J57DRAFT_1225904 [Mycena rebaudengoi]|nr:hypothetical protein C8J57DRAFT_1225904 [Mycena rebaudengoi]